MRHYQIFVHALLKQNNMKMLLNYVLNLLLKIHMFHYLITIWLQFL